MPSRKRPETYLERSRRAQLIASTISVIADRGYANTSLADVAAHAGTSKGVLLYHFAGKDDLISAVVEEVFTVARAELVPKLEGVDDPAERLAVYIRERIGFLATHRAHMQALLDIWLGYRSSEGTPVLDATTAEPTLAGIEEMLRAGQVQGRFRDFPTRPMAVTVGQAIDGVLLQLLSHPDLDLDEYAREISTIFDLATRRAP